MGKYHSRNFVSYSIEKFDDDVFLVEPFIHRVKSMIPFFFLFIKQDAFNQEENLRFILFSR